MARPHGGARTGASLKRQLWAQPVASARKAVPQALHGQFNHGRCPRAVLFEQIAHADRAARAQRAGQRVGGRRRKHLDACRGEPYGAAGERVGEVGPVEEDSDAPLRDLTHQCLETLAPPTSGDERTNYHGRRLGCLGVRLTYGLQTIACRRRGMARCGQRWSIIH
eukprot:scaffold9487_cov105-Isochrysis_galbana.AAC.8